VVVDQFEELFRYTVSSATKSIAEQAAAFVNLLLEVKERANCRIYVVLTMRSDFLGDCTQFPGLAEAIKRGAVSGAADDPGRAPRRHRAPRRGGRRGDVAGLADAAGSTTSATTRTNCRSCSTP